MHTFLVSNQDLCLLLRPSRTDRTDQIYSKHQIIVERVGEEGRERVMIDAGDGSFTDQVSINLGNEARQEITIGSSDSLKGFALRASLVIEESAGDTK